MYTRDEKLYFSGDEFDHVVAGINYLGDGVPKAAKRSINDALHLRGDAVDAPGIVDVISLPRFYAEHFLAAREIGKVIMPLTNAEA